jgi:hypothetical protein
MRTSNDVVVAFQFGYCLRHGLPANPEPVSQI